MMRLKRYLKNTARAVPGLIKHKVYLFFIFALLFFSLVGCGPTYPKDRVTSSIIDLCKKEYGIDVEVKIIGKTIGVYIPIHELLDKDLTISSTAVRKVDDVIMSVSRVALSTDAGFNFYVVIAQDPIIPEFEIVIIRYVEDIKRFMVMDISRSEYYNRMITELKLTPQVQKERLIRQLFEKIGIEISDQVMEEYFKSGYITTIADIGYWNKAFFLKDLTMGEFLARQIEERVRKDFSRVDSLSPFKLKVIKGSYQDGIFDFKMDVDLKIISAAVIAPNRTLILKHVHGVLSKVLHGYKFKDYSRINLFYGGEKIVFTKEDLENLKEGKIKLENII